MPWKLGVHLTGDCKSIQASTYINQAYKSRRHQALLVPHAVSPNYLDAQRPHVQASEGPSHRARPQRGSHPSQHSNGVRRGSRQVPASDSLQSLQSDLLSPQYAKPWSIDTATWFLTRLQQQEGRCERSLWTQAQQAVFRKAMPVVAEATQSGKLQVPQLVPLIRVLARLQVREQVLVQALARLAVQQAEYMQPQAISATLQSLQHMKVRNFSPEQLMARFLAVLPNASASHCSSVLRAATQLGWHSHGDHLAIARRFLQTNSTSTDHICQVVKALADAQVPITYEVEQLVRNFLTYMDAATPRQLASLLVALQRWHEQGVTTRLDLEDVLRSVLATLGERAGECEPQDLAGAAWAGVKTGWAQREDLGRVFHAFPRVLPRAKAQHVSIILWAAATAGYRDVALVRACLKRMGGVLSSAQAQELANSLWAAASLEVYAQELVTPLLLAFSGVAFNASAVSCSNVMWAMNRWGVCEDAAARAALQRGVATQLTSGTCATLIMVGCQMGVVDAPTLHRLLDAQLELRAQWTVTDIAKALAGLARAKFADETATTGQFVQFLAANIHAMPLLGIREVVDTFLMVLPPTDPRLDTAIRHYCRLCHQDDAKGRADIARCLRNAGLHGHPAYAAIYRAGITYGLAPV